MSKNVQEYVILCTKYFLTKSIKYKFYELLQLLSIFTKLRKNETLNFITDLLLSKRREQVYDIILIIINNYTKYFKYILSKKKLNNKTFDERVI